MHKFNPLISTNRIVEIKGFLFDLCDVDEYNYDMMLLLWVLVSKKRKDDCYEEIFKRGIVRYYVVIVHTGSDYVILC